MKKVHSFIPNQSESGSSIALALTELQNSDTVEHIFVSDKLTIENENKVKKISYSNFSSSTMMSAIADAANDSDYIMLLTKETAVKFGQFAVERLVDVAEATGAGIVYSDYIEIKDGKQIPHSVTDYQVGSLRDDFNFGPVVLFSTKAFLRAVNNFTQDFESAGLYYLRLKMSQNYEFIRIPEFLYTIDETDIRKSGQKIFDYVDPKNRQVQVEMEKAATEHLKNVNAWLPPVAKKIEFAENDFNKKASVIIPVRNRDKTISDAIKSVLSQKTDFDFNLIIIDNHSTDKTTEIISQFVSQNADIVHIIPQRTDLGIGGCWNEGVGSDKCGMFAVQLDSDDIYKDENVLQKIVDAFYKQNCAMVVGTYQLVNFDLEEIPPGIIDHKEWTDDNGHNNALRINGLGAPRAFYTPVLREVKVPNISYGEDYAVGLRISRDYRIGRIYENLYLCRRWDDNSDAALDIDKMNKHNLYKDRIRTIELKARKLMS